MINIKIIWLFNFPALGADFATVHKGGGNFGRIIRKSLTSRVAALSVVAMVTNVAMVTRERHWKQDWAPPNLLLEPDFNGDVVRKATAAISALSAHAHY